MQMSREKIATLSNANVQRTDCNLISTNQQWQPPSFSIQSTGSRRELLRGDEMQPQTCNFVKQAPSCIYVQSQYFARGHRGVLVEEQTLDFAFFFISSNEAKPKKCSPT